MNSSESSTALIVADDQAEAMGQAAETPVNPVLYVHSLLRGRYWLAILLAVIGIGAGAVVGYRIQQPSYQSTGLIRVMPSLPRILYQSDQNGLMPMFDAFVESQCSLMRNQRVTDHAMEQPEWRALRRSLSPAQLLEEMIDFGKNLTVEHPRGSEVILVSFTDEDPYKAQVAVKCVINSFQQLYGENDQNSLQSRLSILQARQAELTQQQKQAVDAVARIVGTLGVEGLKQLYDAKLSQRVRLEMQLQEAKLAVALSEGHSPTTVPSQTKEAPLELIAMRYPEIARLVSSRRDLERRLAVEQTQFGANHPSVVDARVQLKAIKAQLDEILKEYRQQGLTIVAVPGASGKRPDQLTAELASVQKLFDDAQREADEWGVKCNNVERAQTEVNALKAKLDETLIRIEVLKTEGGVGGRISVENPGDVPRAPVKDKRVAFAAAGGLGLGGLGVGLVLLLGLLDSRVRHISDVPGVRRRNAILGVLPMLPDEEADPEQAMLAAHAVHQIRIRLQQHEPPGKKPVFAITSASPGAGKTSLTLALGLSFAASGARTLLIDCDIIGGGMTAKMKKVTRRRLGHILRRLGLINTEQLVAAVKESKRRSELVGETLMRQGLVTVADVEHALGVQRDDIIGLREALQGDPANECITGSGSQGLFLMPLGSAQRQHVAQLSYPALRRLIEQVRGWFDVILIDTGPILGSLEAPVVAMAADAVVLTVASGEQRPLIKLAMDQITAIGNKLAGIVLNRASAIDVAASGFSSSSTHSARESSARHAHPLSFIDHQSLRLGPLGSAVLNVGADSGEAPKSP